MRCLGNLINKKFINELKIDLLSKYFDENENFIKKYFKKIRKGINF